MNSIDLNVVVLSAGLGTRMKSRTAKVLHEAGGKPLVGHVVASAKELAPAQNILLVVGHQAEKVRTVLGSEGVRFVVQTEQKGTGDALACCREALGEAGGLLLVLYGDTPLLSASALRRLVDEHRRSGAAATVITTRLDDPTGYGRALTDDAGRILAIVEHKVASEEQRRIREINSGIYCFDAALLWRHIGQIAPNPVSHEYYLTDIVEILNGAGHTVRALLHEDSNELLGINTRAELAYVDRIFRDRKRRELMDAGVTIRMPETVVIDVGVRVGMDTIIEPFAQLLGATDVGEDCRIGSAAIIINAQLSDGVAIAPFTLVEKSKVGAGATLGPFARLRAGNVVEDGAHIGNFVELKNTHFGAGAKAGHLSYLGDADIGRESNIGAGTITCNYDGEKKHRTVVGEKCFIGSNATLVAPLEVGDGAYIAAGSAITGAVPADALAIGRSRQENKEGWAKRRRERRSTSE